MKKIIGIAIASSFLLGACLDLQESNDSSTSISDVEESIQLETPPTPPFTENGTERMLESNWNLVSFPIDSSRNLASFISTENYTAIQSVWKWDAPSISWQVYPQTGSFPLLEQVKPNVGYWIMASEAFEWNGTGVSTNTYSLNKGWNLVGYSHSASADQDLSSFFADGGFWEEDCETSETFRSVWNWSGGTWTVHFAGDTASSHPALDAFNASNSSSFSFLNQLQPGMGIWVNSARSQAATNTSCTLSNTQTVVDLGSSRSFTLPENTISFALHANGSSQQNIRVFSVSNPNGQNLFQNFSQFLLSNRGYGNALVPMIPSMSLPSGNWNFSASNSATNFKLTLRTGPTPTSSTLDVQAYVTGTQFSASDIQGGLDRLKQTYESAGLIINLKDTIVVSGGQYATVDIDFNDSTTSALISQGTANTVNLFFAEDLAANGTSGLLGIASGIPGSIGIQGSYNGVLIGLAAHESGNQLNSQLLGETAAHEMGHWLGLFHTTESSGQSHDPLDDTPECNSSSPSASNCRNSGGDNLMFWQASGSFEQNNLSADQVHIINNSPLAY